MIPGTRRVGAVSTALALVLLAVALPGRPARAVQDTVVEEMPLYDEPRIMDGRVYAIVTHGDTVFVGGTFTTIREAPSDTTVDQPYLFKFDVTTGDIDGAFAPALDGDVEGLAVSDDGRSLWVGGNFTTVNGASRARLVKLSTTDGAVDTAFVSNHNQRVRDIALTADGQVITGGQFRYVNGVNRERLAAVDAGTGAVLDGFDLPVTGSRDEYAPYVQELDVSPDGAWLVIGGNFQDVGGDARTQIAVIDLSGQQAAVANWSTDRYVPDCVAVYDDTYIRGLDVAPDSSWFEVNTTGAYRGADSLCDTATRWELPPVATGNALQPTWTTHTGGDTHWASHITNAAVYVGGHQRWENNPYPSPGGDNDGPGSVSRPGIAALDPLTGVPLSWNPGRDRGRGVEALHSTDDHLFVGSDTALFNGFVRQRLAVLPAGATANPRPDDVVLPVVLHVADQDGALQAVPFDGSAFGASETVSGPQVDGLDWRAVRDGFLQHDRVVYFGPDDAYYWRPYDVAGFGEETNLSATVGYVDDNRDLTPYDQPYGVAEVETAAYANGRIYYTKRDDARLWWRYYALESGLVAGLEHVASHADWSGATALDVIGGWVYAAWEDGALYRAHIGDDAVGIHGMDVVDDGAAGVDWSTVGAMFSSQDAGDATPPPPPPDPECPADAPWLARYHLGQTLQPPVVGMRCEAAVDHDWGTGAPQDVGVGADDFSVRWTRRYELSERAVLEFTAAADDGVRISVDGVRIIDEWREQQATTFEGATTTLEPGVHDITVEYFEVADSALISVTLAEASPPPPPRGADTTAPDTMVDHPEPRQVLAEPDPVIVGTAGDDVGVTAVDIAVRDVANAQWLQADGETFAADYARLPATLDAPGATSTGWSFAVELADGSYAVQARARDAADNADASPPWVPFEIVTE